MFNLIKKNTKIAFQHKKVNKSCFRVKLLTRSTIMQQKRSIFSKTIRAVTEQLAAMFRTLVRLRSRIGYNKENLLKRDRIEMASTQ